MSFCWKKGTPQGSVISHILFLIAINDFSPKGVNISMFADDTAIWKTGSGVNEVKNRVQQALKYIKKWCGLWAFKVSIDTISVVLFSWRIVKGKVELKFDGLVLNTGKRVNFGGMIFDSSLSWKDHICYVTDKCNKRINLWKVLA